MSDEQPTTAGRRRGRGAEASARAGALERLKALRQGGRRSGESGGYDIKLENPIYETVDDDEYDKLVARRREEARGFIIDDDGLGYGDEGQEEDWTIPGFASSSDDELSEAQKSTKKKREGKKEKKENGQHVKRANPSLTAAAALMGKQRLSAMFTSTAMFKKPKEDRIKDSESVIDEVLAEFAPDDTDRVRRRRTPLVSVPINNKSTIPVSSIRTENQPAIVSPNLVQKQEVEIEMGPAPDNESEVIEEEQSSAKESEELKLDSDVNGVSTKEDVIQEKEEVKELSSYKLNAKIVIEEKDPSLSASAGWKAVISGNGVAEEVKTGVLNSDEQADFEVDADGTLPFYVLDAHEQFYGVNMGTVYLFGKVMRQLPCQLHVF